MFLSSASLVMNLHNTSLYNVKLFFWPHNLIINKIKKLRNHLSYNLHNTNTLLIRTASYTTTTTWRDQMRSVVATRPRIDGQRFCCTHAQWLYRRAKIAPSISWLEKKHDQLDRNSSKHRVFAWIFLLNITKPWRRRLRTHQLLIHGIRSKIQGQEKIFRHNLKDSMLMLALSYQM